MASIQISVILYVIAAVIGFLAGVAPFVNTPYQSFLSGLSAFIQIVTIFLLALNIITLRKALKLK